MSLWPESPVIGFTTLLLDFFLPLNCVVGFLIIFSGPPIFIYCTRLIPCDVHVLIKPAGSFVGYVRSGFVVGDISLHKLLGTAITQNLDVIGLKRLIGVVALKSRARTYEPLHRALPSIFMIIHRVPFSLGGHRGSDWVSSSQLSRFIYGTNRNFTSPSKDLLSSMPPPERVPSDSLLANLRQHYVITRESLHLSLTRGS